MKSAATPILMLILTGCEPAPRDVVYFETHPDETAKVLVACAAGKHRSEECVNANGGEAAIKRKARMELYRKGF